jgi:chemotaxis-related protein WspB
MLALTFEAAGERLALDVRSVVEVVPRVRLRQLAGAPSWLSGAFVYRGRVVPVVDLNRLAGAGECPAHLSSRIILVRRAGPAGEWLLGLVAARVDDVQSLEPAAATLDGFTSEGQPDFGPVAVEKGEMLRWLDLDRMLPDAYRDVVPTDLREQPR